MTQKILVAASILFGIATIAVGVLSLQRDRGPTVYRDYHLDNVESMPIVQDDPYAHLAFGGMPNEQRDEAYRRWLSVSLKISVNRGSGSGTIVYYDDRDGYAYVQSCGHLWSGNRSAQNGTPVAKCKVIAWYHNETKLGKPLEYPAEVLYYSNTRGRDSSLLRFKPDWIPLYIPIAPLEFEFKPDMRFHSCGADGGREVAHYDVRYLGYRGVDLVTTENSPRPGRSGGGLMSEDFYVGICWGTTDKSGGGNGLFTPLKIVREMNEINGFGWLNEVGASWARRIPVIDRNNPQGNYPLNYIPLPNRG